MQTVLSEVRACLEDLRRLGIDEVGMPVAENLSICPPGVVGLDRGGVEVCRHETLAEIRAALGACQRCALSQGRTQIVFGSGSLHAPIVFVGEAPTREEDLTGLPFGGEAGELFERMLLAMELSRSEVYLCDAVMCRSPQHPPSSGEIATCAPFLSRQLEAVRPRVIVVFGEMALQGLQLTAAPLAAVRGSWLDFNGTPLLPTFSPTHLLRHPSDKRLVWEDLKLVMRRLRER